MRPANSAQGLATYLFIGGLGAGLYAAIGTSLTELAGLAPAVSSIVAYAISVPVIFVLQRAYTFRPDQVMGRMFWRYLSVQVSALLLSAVVVSLMVAGLGIGALPAFLATALFIGIASFFVHRAWTFSTDTPRDAR